MSAKEIKLLMEILDIPLTGAAAAIGCSKGDLSATLSGKRRKPAIRKSFVKFLREQITEEKLFGGFTAPSG